MVRELNVIATADGRVAPCSSGRTLAPGASAGVETQPEAIPLTMLEIASSGWVSIQARKALALLDHQPSSQ